MPKRPKRSRQASRRSRLEFAAIEIVGGVLPPEIVTRIAAFDMAGQSEEEYGILRGLKLRDEIARYYRVAMAHWERFAAVRDDNPEASVVFTLDLLRDCFGFIDIRETGTLVLAGREFPIRHAAHAGKVPVVLAPVAPTESRKTGIDEALPLFGEVSRGRSATQLLQDYLNASDTSLWGMTSDGSTLRLMRDNASLTRPAWIEAGLEKIFSERLFSGLLGTVALDPFKPLRIRRQYAEGVCAGTLARAGTHGWLRSEGKAASRCGSGVRRTGPGFP